MSSGQSMILSIKLLSMHRACEMLYWSRSTSSAHVSNWMFLEEAISENKRAIAFISFALGGLMPI